MRGMCEKDTEGCPVGERKNKGETYDEKEKQREKERGREWTNGEYFSRQRTRVETNSGFGLV